MKLKKLIAQLLVVGACNIGLAHASALDQLRAFVTQTKTAQGQFTQTVLSRAKKVLSSGEFIFARPDKFRWSYLKPYQQIIILDGRKLTIYDQDLNQVSIKKFDAALGNTPAALLFGKDDIEQRFTWKELGNQGGVAWLEGSPREQDTSFERVRIGLREEQLVALELHDALGQTTLLNFEHIQRNVKISGNPFQFVAPPGTDVLQND